MSNKNQKDIYLRLNTTIENPYYLFRLLNNDTENVLDLFLEDKSSNGDIYNKFTLPPSSLHPSTYDYQVWETSTQDENLTGTHSLLTTGLLKVVDLDDLKSRDIYYKG